MDHRHRAAHLEHKSDQPARFRQHIAVLVE